MSKQRPAGDGMVRLRKDGRWEGRIVIGHKENGDSIFHYFSAPTQHKLMETLAQAKAEYAGVNLCGDCQMPLGDWLDRWLTEYAAPTIRPSTLSRYRRDLTQYVKPTLGEKPVYKVTKADIQQLYQELLEHGRVHEDADGSRALSPSTGLQLGEICGLQWDDFHEEKGTLTVRRTVHTDAGGTVSTGETKTNQGKRNITLPPSTVELLLHRQKHRLSKQWSFPDPLHLEQPMHPQKAYRRMKELLMEPNCRTCASTISDTPLPPCP